MNKQKKEYNESDLKFVLMGKKPNSRDAGLEFIHTLKKIKIEKVIHNKKRGSRRRIITINDKESVSNVYLRLSRKHNVSDATVRNVVSDILEFYNVDFETITQILPNVEVSVSDYVFIPKIKPIDLNRPLINLRNKIRPLLMDLNEKQLTDILEYIRKRESKTVK